MIVNTQPINYIWCALGAVLALPGNVVITYLSATRLKVLNAIASFIGGALGFPLTLFIWATSLASVHLEGAVVMVGTFFIASMTGVIGALLVNFLFGGNERPRNTQVEY